MTKQDCTIYGYEILEKLAKPMDDNEIEWKVQTVTRGQNGLRALVVPYVQVRAIQNRLDTVCGLGWRSKFHIILVGNTKAVECTISILSNGEWISRTDAAEMTHIEEVKGGYSDSMKRAAVQFGIGRFLYSLPQQWVDILPNRPQQNSEYFSGKYKVNGSEEFVKGYYIRPSVNQILNRRSSPQQQPPMNTNNTSVPTNSELQEIQRYVTDCLNTLKIPATYIPNLFRMVKVQGYTAIEQATFPELQKLYEMLGPVKMYMLLGKKQFHLNDSQLFMYASELLQQPVGKVSNLFNKLNSDGVKIIFNRIRENQQQRMA